MVKKEFLILAVPIMALIVWAIADFSTTRGTWQCAQVVCGKTVTADEWINQNCYPLPQNQNEIVCTVNIDNSTQLVPLRMIDTNSLNRCIDPICVQEVRVRNTNHSVSNVTVTTGGA